MNKSLQIEILLSDNMNKINKIIIGFKTNISYTRNLQSINTMTY